MSSWYTTHAPEDDIAVSTRIRLARNLSGLPFPARMTPEQRKELNLKVKNAVLQSNTPFAKSLKYIDMADVPQTEIAAMVERHIISPEFAEENAASIMEDCLGVYDEIHAVICQNDLMAEGCYREIEKAGKVGEILIVGFDGQRSVVEKIREGGIYGTVLEPPDMAVTAVEKLCDYLDGEELSPVYYQESIPIYPEDAERFLEENLAW